MAGDNKDLLQEEVVTNQLISLKKLLDKGLITEADYELKKSELLGLPRGKLVASKASNNDGLYQYFDVVRIAFSILFAISAIILYCLGAFYDCIDEDLAVFIVVFGINAVGFLFTMISIKKNSLWFSVISFIAHSANVVILFAEDILRGSSLAVLFYIALLCAIVSVVSPIIKERIKRYS